jgi:hypothetical protein
VVGAIADHVLELVLGGGHRRQVSPPEQVREVVPS